MALLETVKTWEISAQDYTAANLVTLLRALRGDLRGLDLSGLVLRGAYLQGVEMQDTNLAHTFIRGTRFTETFDAGTAVAISHTGDTWATGSRRGDIRCGDFKSLTLRRVWRAHSDIICDLHFSPDGQTLVSSGSWRRNRQTVAGCQRQAALDSQASRSSLWPNFLARWPCGCQQRL